MLCQLPVRPIVPVADAALSFPVLPFPSELWRGSDAAPEMAPTGLDAALETVPTGFDAAP